MHSCLPRYTSWDTQFHLAHFVSLFFNLQVSLLPSLPFPYKLSFEESQLFTRQGCPPVWNMLTICIRYSSTCTSVLYIFCKSQTQTVDHIWFHTFCRTYYRWCYLYSSKVFLEDLTILQALFGMIAAIV